MVLFEAVQVGKTVGARQVLDGLSFTFRTGRLYGIIGPNGVGKSTLLGLLSGVDSPTSGRLLFNGELVQRIPRRQLAKQMAVLQQSGLPPAGFTVREAVEMGRFPYQNWLGDERTDAGPIIDKAIASMGLASLQHRKLDQLSGGERQRAAFAKVIAQETDIMLLDEPTTHLDIGYQIQMLDMVKNWQRERGRTAIAVLHDLNLASLYCDELLVLHKGRAAAFGKPADIVTAKLIEEVYETKAAVVDHPQDGSPQILLVPDSAGQ
ncbi:ABC transporter ATP-binding protein [Paenibacillus protaetiae]|uniref:ABC transporter ATP-binding protein n=1 Tax=Paenibacillus protaetiae TaxID=2509456 RepID=A0A4P6EYG1_9BACL|nr:ABC transporter ATP-binding protein [Paenibacillus protaetiae]QAY65687.1 ABC transporter ATP-binding protein [Paenibacillus protaetiae]